MGYKIEFAGTKLHEIVQISKVNISVLPSRENFTRSIPAYNGSILSGFKYSERIISVDISIPTVTRNDFSNVVQKLAYALDVSNPSKLIINNSNIVYYAVLDGDTDINKLYNTGTTTINFVCHDPIGYENAYTGTMMDSSKIFRFTDMGTYNSYPILGFKFSKPSTFLYLTNEKSEVMMIGSKNNGTIQTVPENNIIVSDNCTNSSTFTNGGNVTVSDNRVVGGNFGVGNSGNSIVATNYGTDVKNKWTGTTFRRNLGKNLEQFEVRTNFSFTSKGENFTALNPNDLVRVIRKSGTYLYSKSDFTSGILCHIPYGTDVNILVMGNNRSCKVRYNGKTGWVDTNDIGRIQINTKSTSRKTYADEQMGLIEACGYDSSGQLLFRFHIRDDSKYFEHVIPEVYIKDKLYLSSNTTIPTPNKVTEKDEYGKPTGEVEIPSGAFGVWNDYTGTFTIRRKKLDNGKYRWWAKINRTLDGVTVTQTIDMGAGVVNDSLPKGNLNHIIFYIAKYDGAEPVSLMSVNHITVLDISNEDGNQQEEVNYEIFKNGDLLEIDFEKCTVKLNNENFIHKLDIGSQFFSVGKNSRIVVKSDDTGVTGTCSYRKRYI